MDRLTALPSAPTVGILTLGCKVNQYESEAIAEALTARGFSLRPETDLCDVYIINTCTVTAESDRKARQFIRRAITRNPCAYILVTGCLGQTQAQNVAAIPGVDFVCGNDRKMQIVDRAEKLVLQGQKNAVSEIAAAPLNGCRFEPMKITHFDRTRAYIKIEDGCESRCTYCIIPTARGEIRSKPMEDVLDEVRGLIHDGCHEVVLTGIETASWGRDLPGRPDLGDLLAAIDALPGIGRVRLGSLDPSLIKPAFVEKIAGLCSIAPHFHLSLQSGSDRILAAMKRKYNRTQALRAIGLLRAAMPDVQFTTDVIVGFPGETEEDFAATLDFAEEAKFLMIHVFPYSKRAGTPAAVMKDQVPESVKHERAAILIARAEKIRAGILAEQVGKTVPVLFETCKNGVRTGHTPSFIEVSVPGTEALHAQTRQVLLTGITDDRSGMTGQLTDLSDTTSCPSAGERSLS